jgi:farnesyl diphosphate synthase
MSLKVLMDTYRQQVDNVLDSWLPQASIQPTRLHQAMRYAVLNGGKRVRPLLVYFSAQALGIEASAVNGAAAAVELIHAYSLVHDDLPAMDNDDLRRGQPTCHKAFDEATALLVGDALQTLAFYILSHDPTLVVSCEHRLEMIMTLAMASGSRGMAGGQAIDMAAVGQSLNLAELENMHIHKTGALIRASVKLGALADHSVERELLDKLDHYAKCIGLAFQIQDDILDEEVPTETLGKTHGADRAQGKPTYPALLGLPAAKQMSKELIEQALMSLEHFDHQADPLRWIARYIVTRTY